MARAYLRAGFLLFAAAGLLAGGLFWPPSPTAAQEKITFQLGWIASGRDTAFFTAKGRGYYKEKGLDVTLVRGWGGADAVKKVGAKAVPFAFGDVAANIVGRAKEGAKVKQLFMYHAKATYAIHSLKGYGIEKPKDLEGKKLGGPPGDATWAVLPALAAANNVDLKKVEIVHMTPEAGVPSLLAGRVHGIGMWTYQTPILEEKAIKEGKEVYVLAFAKWGVDVYNIGVVAHDETIAKRPDLVRGFVEATAQGAKWAVENPDQAIEYYHQDHREQSKDINLKMWKLTVDYMVTPEAMKNGLGWMGEEKWRYTVDVIAKAYQIPSPPPLKDLYTNEFLPKLIPAVKK